jgi:hypothetical protein
MRRYFIICDLFIEQVQEILKWHNENGESGVVGPHRTSVNLKRWRVKMCRLSQLAESSNVPKGLFGRRLSRWVLP